VLALLTALAGIVGVPSAHGTAFARFLAPVLPLHQAEHGGVTALSLAAVSVVVALAGVFVAWLVYGRAPVDASRIGVPRNALHRLVLNKYYVDEIYDALIVNPAYQLYLWCARVFDLRVIDGIVNGVGSMVVAWARSLRRVQTGFVMNYALTMLLGALAVVAFLLARAPR
jgi:NADH-quinone oxidoreductase subunit L